MKREVFERCKKIDDDVKTAKDFLKYYHDNEDGNDSKLFKIFCKKAFVKKTLTLCGKTRNNFICPYDYYNIPEELQKRIVETIEVYVDEKEKELEEL